MTIEPTWCKDHALPLPCPQCEPNSVKLSKRLANVRLRAERLEQENTKLLGLLRETLPWVKGNYDNNLRGRIKRVLDDATPPEARGKCQHDMMRPDTTIEKDPDGYSRRCNCCGIAWEVRS